MLNNLNVYGQTWNCVHIGKSSRENGLEGTLIQPWTLKENHFPYGTHCPKAGDISTALVLVASAAICFVEGNPIMESTWGKFLILFTVERGMHTDNGEHGQGLGPFCCLAQSRFTCVYTLGGSSLEAPATSSVAQELTSAIWKRQQLKHMRNRANFNVGVWKCEFVCSHPHVAL